jgi:hypothetical protein
VRLVSEREIHTNGFPFEHLKKQQIENSFSFVDVELIDKEKEER